MIGSSPTRGLNMKRTLPFTMMRSIPACSRDHHPVSCLQTIFFARMYPSIQCSQTSEPRGLMPRTVFLHNAYVECHEGVLTRKRMMEDSNAPAGLNGPRCLGMGFMVSWTSWLPTQEKSTSIMISSASPSDEYTFTPFACGAASPKSNLKQHVSPCEPLLALDSAKKSFMIETWTVLKSCFRRPPISAHRNSF